jgi:hypothetical protein
LADFVVFFGKGVNYCIQTALRRLRELLFLDWDIGLLASSPDPNFAGRNLFNYSKPKLKNQKPIAVDVFFKAFPMIPL